MADLADLQWVYKVVLQAASTLSVEVNSDYCELRWISDVPMHKVNFYIVARAIERMFGGRVDMKLKCLIGRDVRLKITEVRLPIIIDDFNSVKELPDMRALFAVGII